ncbi:hypothetical protein [Aquimarina sp. MMG016]|uniref:hypothetical protein n=1 Tax=Aquimarina sp. MMG016 TaxID=2822690 RepID=UPI001B39CEC8|nr:hypothetical protein [Aquimarina sp. MMG016]MBQ4818619.1 hypothetical protein [Aquimarina sp. MMG016]
MEEELKEYFESLREAIDHIGNNDADVESRLQMAKTVLLSMADQMQNLSTDIRRLNKDYYNLD